MTRMAEMRKIVHKESRSGLLMAVLAGIAAQIHRKSDIIVHNALSWGASVNYSAVNANRA